jgi:hypothetical protein
MKEETNLKKHLNSCEEYQGPRRSAIVDKQETLEEAAERLYPEEWDWRERKVFINGAKWMQERMYSEEDMISFAEFVATYLDKNRNVNGEMLHAKSKYDGAERTIDLLKQFKKK